ncbi:MAG: fibronectin type III domain-containing protein, partial [Coriobacteriales bacterium]|nr:fibronectin type III domain-containing protein [Coriobacteriales bacterium]
MSSNSHVGVGSFGRGFGKRVRQVMSMLTIACMLSIYATPGVAAAGSSNCNDSDSHRGWGWHKRNDPPYARLADHMRTYVGVPIELDASASRDYDGTIVKYEWDIDDDGDWDHTTTAPQVTVTFDESGKHYIRLRVTDDDGAHSTDRGHLRVRRDYYPPVAVIVAPATALAGESVTLNGGSSCDCNGIITQYRWDFESDGTVDHVSADPTVQHAWDSPGTYTVTLTVRDAAGKLGSRTKRIEITPGVDEAPQPPTGLTAGDRTGDEGGAVSLSWSASPESDLDVYRVYRVASPPIVVAEVTGTSFTDTGLTDGTTYDYFITAVDLGGNESAQSAPVSATPIDDTAPSAPGGLSAVDVPDDDGDALAVSWSASDASDLVGYTLKIVDEVAGTTEVLDVPAETTSHTFTGLTTGRTYAFAVAAYDEAHNTSAFSTAVSAAPSDERAPAVPSGVTAADHPDDEGRAIDVWWTPNTENDLGGYRVYRTTMATAETILAADVTGVAAWTDTNCIDGVDYGYVVKAYDIHANESGASDLSVARSFDTLPPLAVSGGSAADVPNDQGGAVSVTWLPSMSVDVDGYRVDCIDGDGVVVDSFSGGSSVSSHVFTGLETGTEYGFVVIARDIAGNESAGSPTLLATPRDNLAPAQPTGLTAVDVVPDQGGAVALSWTANTEADLAGYVVNCYDSSGALVEQRNVGFATNPVFENLGVEVDFTFEVLAKDANGNSSPASDRVAGHGHDEIAPDAVTAQALDRPADQGGMVDVVWTASAAPDTAGYKVYRDGGEIADVTDLSFADAVNDRDAHIYTVKAYDGSGNLSEASPEVTASAIDNLAPAAPTGLSAVDVADDDGGEIAVSYTLSADTDVEAYRLLCYAPDGSVFAERFVAALDTSYTFQGLTDGIAYTFDAIAIDTSGNQSDASASASASAADQLAPDAPTALTAVDTPADEGGSIDLAWTASTAGDTAGYSVFRDGAKIADVIGVAYTDADAGTAVHEYVVKAFDEVPNVSVASNAVSGLAADNVAPAVPDGLTATDKAGDDGGSVELAWNAVDGAATYSVYRDGTRIASGLTAAGYSDNDAVTGTTYSYTVTALDAAGNESAQSAAASAASADDLAPAAPAGLTASDASGDDGGVIELAWTAVDGAATYSVFRDGTRIASGLTGPGYTDNTADTGTTYSYTVTAIDAAGNESAQSAAASAASADDLAPSVPSDLAATPDPAGGAIDLSWTAVSGAVGYKIFVNGTEVGDVTGTSFNVAGLTNGTAYSISIAAYDAVGNTSAPSAPVLSVPADVTAPAAPSGVSAADAPGDDGGAVEIAWGAVDGAATYAVYRDGVAIATGLTGTTFTDTNAETGTDYSYTVVAVDASGNASDPSTAVTAASADDSAPAAPTGLSAVDTPNDNGGSIDLSWDAVPGASSYAVYRDGVGITSALAATSFTDDTAETGTSYTYTVTAFDGSGNESPASAGASAASADTLAPEVPSGLSAADTPNDHGGSIDLSWDAVSGAAGYTVYRDGAELAAGITGTSYTDATTADGTVYSYTVSASDAAGNESAQSAAATAESADQLGGATQLIPPTNVLAQDNPRDYGAAVRISWNASTDPRVTGYRIYRSDAADGIFTQVGETTGDEFLNTGLTAGTDYFYVVRSVDAAGNESPDSNGAATAPVDNSIPTTTRYENTHSQVSFNGGWVLANTWDYGTMTSAGSLNYATAGTNAVANTTACTFTFTGSQVTWIGLEATNRGIAAVYIDGVFQRNVDLYDASGFIWQAPVYTSPVLIYGPHTIRVVYTGTKNAAATGYNAIDVDAFDVTVIPEFQAPVTPSGLAATPTKVAAGQAIDLSWYANNEADLAGYKVYRSTSADGPFDVVATLGKVTSYGDASLTNGTTYFYKITAFDTFDNESGTTAVKSAAPMAAPTGLAVADHPADEGTALDLT